MFIVPDIFRSEKKILALQSTRNGGFSKGNYSSLNLGLSTQDDNDVILKNREILFNRIGFKPSQTAFSGQIHDANILIADCPVFEKGHDAIISNTPGLLIGISIADCTPILIYDPVAKAVAAIHAGWKGTCKNIVTKTMQAMQKKFNSKPENCLAYIGACISVNAFEVGDEVAAKFYSNEKIFMPDTNKYHVDLKLANKHQLLLNGIKEINIEVSQYCTVNNNDLFFSHRKENGITGRMMALIAIES